MSMIKAYDFHVQNAWLDAYLEIHGSYWDDKEAEKQSVEFYKKSNELLFKLIQAMPTLDKEEPLRLRAKEIMSKELPYTDIRYTKAGNEKSYEVKTESDRLDELKTIFNPNSNTADNRALFWDVYFTDEIKMGTILQLFLENLQLAGKRDEVHEKIFKMTEFNEGKKPSDALRKINNFITDKANETDPLRRAIISSLKSAMAILPEFINRFASEVVKFQYIVHTSFLGLDIADESTWSDEFKMLFHIFLFKKYVKILSTNIYGAAGRNSAFALDYYDENGIAFKGENWYSIKEPLKVEEWSLDVAFNPLSAASLRWTSKLHSLPAGSPVRRVFAAPKGKLAVHFDLSQNELCVMALESGEQKMLEGFMAGKDMHRYMASYVFNKPMEEISGEERRATKAVNFGLLYAKGIASLAADTFGGDIEHAQKVYNLFFDTFPNVKKWIESKHKEVDTYGYVTGHFGNILNVEDSGQGSLYRIAQNSPIQSFGSVFAGTYMYKFTKAAKEVELNTRPFSFTHDSYDDYVAIEDILLYMELAYEIMQNWAFKDLGLPAKIDFEVGKNGTDLCHMKVIETSGRKTKFSISGTKEGVLGVVEEFKNSTKYNVLSEELKEEATKYHDWSELFTVGKALKAEWGNTITEVNYEVEVEEKQ